jgi:hypothetical protein
MATLKHERPVIDWQWQSAIRRWAILLSLAIGLAGLQLDAVNAAAQHADGQTAPAPAPSETGLVIENDSELPDTYPHGSYEMRFRAHGAISTMHWRMEKGALPAGIKLEDNGLLHGQAERTGEFQFTVSVTDGGRERGVEKGFSLRVRSAMSLNWKAGVHVEGSRIEGSAEVSNTTPDDIDLTFYVLAVAPNGRATAIGYQHFVLKRGTLAMELPFGENLPHGGYVVRADAVGEVAPKNLIYREYLQTPGPLQVTVGP